MIQEGLFLKILKKLKQYFYGTTTDKRTNTKILENMLEVYVDLYPTHQNALDIFKNQWQSKFPPSKQELITGQIPLFQDRIIAFAEKQLGGFKGCKLLELGPLEGGHTYMLESMGAKSILAIEANTIGYLKCLITKEIMELKRSRFLLGDFVNYLKNTEESYDACIASGVLYHMQNPVELIHLISRKINKIVLWTHYYDETLIKSNPNIGENRFSGSVNSEYQGFKHTLYRQHYQEALVSPKFVGGLEKFSMWMPRADILKCLDFFGFREVAVEFEEPHHPNGPCFCIVGVKP